LCDHGSLAGPVQARLQVSVRITYDLCRLG